LGSRYGLGERRRENAVTSTRKRWRITVALLAVAGLVLVVGPIARAAQGGGVTREQLIGDGGTSYSLLALADAGTLTFQAEVSVAYPATPCPAGTPSGVECFARTGRGSIRGLGNVNESYAYEVESAGCDADFVRLLPTTARLSVPGKGEIELRVGGTGCVARVAPQPLRAEADFTITGGSGRYAGASGGGTYSDLSFGPPSFRGRDTWRGTLVVPGLDFDLTPPALSGATSTTIRAPRRLKRVRVAYDVTAQDDVDGAVPVTCRPRSRSWFKIGRTLVRCSATDTSANESTAAFVVTVKRRR
jgi:hypothetical protein